MNSLAAILQPFLRRRAPVCETTLWRFSRSGDAVKHDDQAALDAARRVSIGRRAKIALAESIPIGYGKSPMARYLFITGGVVSSLGKGLASAALGALLQ